VRPFKATGKFSVKMIGAGGSFILKRIAKFVGSAFLEDMARFFVEFNDVLGGFRERAREVFDLLRGQEVAFVLVTAPEPSVVDEVLFFRMRLLQSSMPFAGFVVNRVHPVSPPPPDDLGRLVAAEQATKDLPPYDLARVTDSLLAADRELGVLATADQLQIARLRAVAGDHPIAQIPFLEHDVHDVRGLTELGGHLFRT
jgi:anion-transporting  ArsA/GET3 family ATPase